MKKSVRDEDRSDGSEHYQEGGFHLVGD
jgi:hypothetical protein